MLEENKTAELKDKDLEKVSGGGPAKIASEECDMKNQGTSPCKLSAKGTMDCCVNCRKNHD